MPPSSRPIPDPSPLHEEPTAVFPAPAPVVGPASEPETLAPALASRDQCTNCGSSLAPDQHYCLVCGERRGAARFSSLSGAGGARTALVTEDRVSPRPPRFSSAATLIAGVATLLIAMGIGVYIGGLGKSSNGSGNPLVRVVTVNGGGAAPTASTASTAATGGGSSGAAGKGKRHGSHKGSSAAKVVTTVKNAPPPTVTIGAHGSGKGFQGGKFTGHFFGP